MSDDQLHAPKLHGPKTKNQKIAFVVGGVVAAGFVWYAYRNANAATATPTTGATDPYAQSAADAAGYGSGGYSPPYGPYHPRRPRVPNKDHTVPTTNLEWLQAGVRELHSEGYAEAHSRKVLTDYLGKRRQDSDDRALVENVLGLIGHPPTGDLGDPLPKKPPPKTPPPQHEPHADNGYYRLLPQNNIFEVRADVRYHVTPATWKEIRAHHPKHIPVRNILANSPVMKLKNGGSV